MNYREMFLEDYFDNTDDFDMDFLNEKADVERGVLTGDTLNRYRASFKKAQSVLNDPNSTAAEKKTAKKTIDNLTKVASNTGVDLTIGTKAKSGEIVGRSQSGTDLYGRSTKAEKAAAEAGRANGKLAAALKKAGGDISTFATGKKGSGKLNRTLQSSGTGVAAAGLGASAVGSARLIMLKKNGPEMYKKAKNAGKTNGMSESEWIASEIKKAKIATIAGSAGLIAGAGIKTGSYFASRKKNEDFDMLCNEAYENAFLEGYYEELLNEDYDFYEDYDNYNSYEDSYNEGYNDALLEIFGE